MVRFLQSGGKKNKINGWGSTELLAQAAILFLLILMLISAANDCTPIISDIDFTLFTLSKSSSTKVYSDDFLIVISTHCEIFYKQLQKSNLNLWGNMEVTWCRQLLPDQCTGKSKHQPARRPGKIIVWCNAACWMFQADSNEGHKASFVYK